MSTTLTAIADWVYRIPGLEWAFIQQNEKLTEDRKTPVQGSPGAWICGNQRLTTYRVVLVYKGKCRDHECASLREALREVFGALGIDLDAKIATAETMRADTATRRPPSSAEPDERAELMAKWQATCAALEVTKTMLGKLRDWMGGAPGKKRDLPTIPATGQPITTAQVEGGDLL